MINLIYRTADKINSWLNGLQVRRSLSIVFVIFILLTTHVDAKPSNQVVSDRLDKVIHQDDSQRPKTTGEWKEEARETQGAPGKRFNTIVKESGEALKEFGSVYPDTAKKSVSELKDSDNIN